MKQFKYTIAGKEYEVEIVDINEETNVANVKVNGEEFEVGMEKPAEETEKHSMYHLYRIDHEPYQYLFCIRDNDFGNR